MAGSSIIGSRYVNRQQSPRKPIAILKKGDNDEKQEKRHQAKQRGRRKVISCRIMEK